MSIPTIKLTEILQYLDSKEPDDKPYLFINPSENLDTFFRYKGTQIDLIKEKVNLDLHPEQLNDIQKNILDNIEIGMRQGGWVVFNIGVSGSFNINNFFKKFSFFKEGMFKPSSVHDKKYCMNCGLFRKENDIDTFGNKGCFEIKDEFKILFLSTAKKEDADSLIKENQDIEFNAIIVD